MAGVRKYPDEGAPKELAHPEPKEPVSEAPAVPEKTDLAKHRVRKSARGRGKATSEGHRTEMTTAKKEKQQKVKMIRDSFNMPKSDYDKIAELKQKCLAAGVHVKKSELLRLGLTQLSMLSVTALLRSVKQIERIKTGRPAKHR